MDWHVLIGKKASCPLNLRIIVVITIMTITMISMVANSSVMNSLPLSLLESVLLFLFFIHII